MTCRCCRGSMPTRPMPPARTPGQRRPTRPSSSRTCSHARRRGRPTRTPSRSPSRRSGISDIRPTNPRGTGGRRSPVPLRRESMRITQIRTRQVDVPLPEPFHPAWARGRVETQIRLAYLRIDTDAGIYGIAGHEFYGAEEQCVARVARELVGKDPLRIEEHAGTLRFLWPYFGTAVWFVEIALWDILGKVAGLPIDRMLGNASDA